MMDARKALLAMLISLFGRKHFISQPNFDRDFSAV